MAKDKKEIKKDILDLFRNLKNDEGGVLPPELLESDYFNRLNWEEKRIYQNAVDELISGGLIENVKGSARSLKLTDKGADLIY